MLWKINVKSCWQSRKQYGSMKIHRRNEGFSVGKKIWKNQKSCWQTKAVMIRYQSCRWEQQQRRITDLWQINSNATLKIPRFSEKWIARFKNKQIDEKDREATRINSKQCQIKLVGKNFLTWEFDPGSGWTLAACLTHASRTEFTWSLAIVNLVADGWVTRG